MFPSVITVETYLLYLLMKQQSDNNICCNQLVSHFAPNLADYNRFKSHYNGENLQGDKVLRKICEFFFSFVRSAKNTRSAEVVRCDVNTLCHNVVLSE